MCRCNECSGLWNAYRTVRDAQMAERGVLDNVANDAYERWLTRAERHDLIGWTGQFSNVELVAFTDRLVSACRGKQTRRTDHLIVALGRKVWEFHSGPAAPWFAKQPEAQRLWDAQEREHSRHMARYDRNCDRRTATR